MCWRSEIDTKNNLKIPIHLKRNLLGLLHESKKPLPHIHVVRHYNKVFIARPGRRRGGGCIEILFVIGREGTRGSFYVTEYGTALTTILSILFLYLNNVIVTAGTFES